MGTPDEGALPSHRTERLAYDLVADGFGPGINGPLVVAVDISRDPSVLEPLATAIRFDKGIASVAPPEINTDAGVATLVAFPTTGPQDSATLETVQRLRTDVIPAVLDQRQARAHIGGQTATFADVGDKVNSRLPLFIGAVIVLSVLLLTLVFRSVVVPLKAALLNLLSIGASFGVIVMVFQWGWGADLIGLESTVPIHAVHPHVHVRDPLRPLHGLRGVSAVRVREAYLATGDNESSIVHGIATTGRVITAAALIMISVFLGFATGSDPTAKMLGLGLATAILVDATLVRLVLLPATMKLLGDANWWIPRWLDRLLPTIDLPRGGRVLPAPAPPSPTSAVTARPAP